MRYLLIIVFLVVASCQPTGEEHMHTEDGGHITSGIEKPSIVSTIWTDSTELFVEYPALVVGQSSRFAAHFTIMDHHQPVREGTVTVSLIKDGRGIRHTVEQPSSPGIFTPSLQPKEAGIYQLVFDIKTPRLTDRIQAGKVQVFTDVEEASKHIPGEKEAGGTISFLKEQAWKIDFQTAPVRKGEIFHVINTSGIWKAAPGTVRSLSANTSGIVNFALENLTEGTIVKKGDLLMIISSKGLATNNIQAKIDQARANYEQVKAEYERKKQLYESRIVPKAELEQVESRYFIAKSSYETLKSGYSAGGKQIRAPFSGFIKSISIGNGDYVEQGAMLLSIGTRQSRLLETHVSPSHSVSLGNIHNIWYQPASGEWSSIKESGGSIQSVGKAVERDKPLIPVFALVNEVVDMPEGSFTEVQIAFGHPDQQLTIPEAALLEDYGSYAVITQLSGETFQRKPVQIGRKNGEYVEILKGLEAGEYVVTKGAYQVKMASMSGQAPAHGHAH